MGEVKSRAVWVTQRTAQYLLEVLTEEVRGINLRGFRSQLENALAEFKDDTLRLKEATARANSNAFWESLQYEVESKNVAAPTPQQMKKVLAAIKAKAAGAAPKTVSKAKAKKARKRGKAKQC